ncbi:MAG: J domain-containing protein [Parashewanella sp.]
MSASDFSVSSAQSSPFYDTQIGSEFSLGEQERQTLMLEHQQLVSLAEQAMVDNDHMHVFTCLKKAEAIQNKVTKHQASATEDGLSFKDSSELKERAIRSLQDELEQKENFFDYCELEPSYLAYQLQYQSISEILDKIFEINQLYMIEKVSAQLETIQQLIAQKQIQAYTLYEQAYQEAKEHDVLVHSCSPNTPTLYNTTLEQAFIAQKIKVLEVVCYYLGNKCNEQYETGNQFYIKQFTLSLAGEPFNTLFIKVNEYEQQLESQGYTRQLFYPHFAKTTCSSAGATPSISISVEEANARTTMRFSLYMKLTDSMVSKRFRKLAPTCHPDKSVTADDEAFKELEKAKAYLLKIADKA